jgi:hypothetical protein
MAPRGKSFAIAAVPGACPPHARAADPEQGRGDSARRRDRSHLCALACSWQERRIIGQRVEKRRETMPSNNLLFQEIQSEAMRRLPRARVLSTNLYIQREILPAGSEIRARHLVIPVERDTVMVFADEEPLANWAHDCRYMLFDARSKSVYKEMPARFPPSLINTPKTWQAFHLPVIAQPSERKLWPLPVTVKLPFRKPVGKRYAILFSGASNNRHVNDMEFLYRTLVDQYYFLESNIYVLNYDGTINYSGGPKPVGNWPGNDTPYRMVVHDAGTKAAFEAVIDDLGARIGAEDLLFVHTNNHGGHDGTNAYLCTYDGPDYTAPDFAVKLAELPSFRDLVVMMEQCHSGGFNDLIVEHSPAQRTSFSAACTEHRSSIGGPDFDPYARDWIAAITGNDPYGVTLLVPADITGEGKISSIEAFAYADRVHDDYDSPVFSERGHMAGHATLAQRWTFIRFEPDFVRAALERTWKGRPVEEYGAWSRAVLVPRLQALEVELERARLPEEQIRTRVREVVEEALGAEVRPRRPRRRRDVGGAVVSPMA